MIVLVGFMGAGKSTVGRLLAERLGCPFTDADELVESRAGATIAEIFRNHGEEAFRALERAVVAEVLGGSGVVALGGGALGDPATRAALPAGAVVHLEVGLEEALRRVGPNGDRPLLAADPQALFESRQGLYSSCADLSVNTEGKTPAEVAGEIAARLAPVRIPVDIPGRGHDVVVGRGLLARFAEFVPVLDRAARALVVTHPGLDELAAPVRASLESSGVEVFSAHIAAGEKAKSLEQAASLYDRLAMARLHRRDLLVSVGGGVLSDLCGFVAATYHRGMPVVHAPTTLLAQVDAAIGGKTAVNLVHGKNLVGAIHQPVAVVCDVDALGTLPQEEYVTGLAEVVKHGLIADPALVELLETRADAVLRRDPPLVLDVVVRSARIKAAVVARDEREAGERVHLNYGHTFGHAIEHTAKLRHGDAVALGMMCAAHLASELGLLDTSDVEVHRRVLSRLGLPVESTLDIDELEPVWQHDKKHDGGLRFVILEAIGSPTVVPAPERALLERALQRVAPR